MKAKIDKIGCLEIERKGKWKKQHCYKQEEEMQCSDYCPLFNEVTFQTKDGEINSVFLCCTSARLEHKVVDDLREGPDA